MDFILQITFTFFGLIIVCAIAWFSLRSIAKFKNMSNSSGDIKITASKAIGQKERIVVLNHKETEYLVAMTTNSICLLDKTPLKDKTYLDDQFTNTENTNHSSP